MSVPKEFKSCRNCRAWGICDFALLRDLNGGNAPCSGLWTPKESGYKGDKPPKNCNCLNCRAYGICDEAETENSRYRYPGCFKRKGSLTDEEQTRRNKEKFGRFNLRDYLMIHVEAVRYYKERGSIYDLCNLLKEIVDHIEALEGRPE
jgi:hypothetical protein